MKRSLVALLLSGLLQPAVFGQQIQPPAPQTPGVQTPATFRGDVRPQPDKQSIADLKWFEVFNDPKLQQLISDALAYNYDVREAVARIVSRLRTCIGHVRCNHRMLVTQHRS